MEALFVAVICAVGGAPFISAPAYGQSAPAQPIMITGTVTDSTNGAPLPGVNILVKGTTTGTATNEEGNYELEAPSEQDTLVASFIGYQTEEVPIRGRTELDISLEPEVIGGDELVVIGYGTQRKSDVTGSLSSIGAEDLEARGNASIGQALQGKVAGVSIRQSTAEPGGELSINIRGAGSISAGSRPLFVVDGVPLSSGSLGGSGESSSRLVNRTSPLNSLSPGDIESVEVLKGASAAAIYGSRGSNGVVLITTKKGRAGQTRVNFSSYVGVQSPKDKIDLLTAQEYMAELNGLRERQGEVPVFSAQAMQSVGEGVNWQDYVMESSPIQEHSLSVSGGNESTNYYTSATYHNNRGVVKNTGIEKFILRASVQQTLKEKLTIAADLNFSHILQDRSLETLQENEDSGPINAALGYDPTLPVRGPNGEYIRSDELTLTHPARILDGMTNTGVRNEFFGNVRAEYEISDALTARLQAGGDREVIRGDFYQNRITIHGASQNGIADVNSVERTHAVAEATLSYSKDINRSNSLNAVGGASFENTVSRSLTAGTSGFPSDQLQTNNLSAGDPTLNSLNSNKNKFSLISYFGRVNYTFNDRYLLTATSRVDGSSRFGKNNRFSVFPSAALAWRAAEEDFVPDLFSQLKVRASWGITGNQEIGNNNDIVTFNPGSAWLGGASQNAIHPARKPNPDLQWEETSEWNLGVDFGFLEGRVSGSVGYYYKDTRELLLNFPLPLSSGYQSILRNVGSMRNTGVELNIESNNIVRDNFSWQSSFNFSHNDNKVTDLGGVDRIEMGQIKLAGGATTLTQVGLPLNSYFGYNVQGFFQNEEEIANSAQPNAEPGFPRFEDVNDDGQITADDRRVIGNQYPTFTYGLQNVLSYKNWTLSFFLRGEYGADLLNLNLIQGMFPANFRRNRFAPLLTDQWTPENRSASWPTAVNPFRYEYGKVNDLVVEDASFLRLQTLQLSYQFSDLGYGMLESARVYGQVKNAITITGFSGYNPEGNVFGSNATARIAWNAYPTTREWTLGVDFTF